MERSQWYIGAQNGIVLCIDQVEDGQTSGRFYHKYKEDATAFATTDQMLFQFEHFFDMMDFPHPGNIERSFRRAGMQRKRELKKAEKMSDKEMLQKHGKLGTFIVRVQHRQNSSWQGRITWMERNSTLYFRSVWEMVKLIAGVVEGGQECDGGWDEQEVAWFGVLEGRA